MDVDGSGYPREPLWSFTELARNGIIDANVPNMSLTNPIHPLFQFRNHAGHEAELQFYTPAFQLASNLVTTDAYLDWWVMVALGRTYEDTIEPPLGGVAENRSRTRRLLLELAEHLHIGFSDIQEDPTDAWAFTELRPPGVVIRLNRKFLHFARRVIFQQARRTGVPQPFESHHRWDGGREIITPAEVLRVQWFVGRVLGHETTHALWQYTHPQRAIMGGGEPFHCMDPREIPRRELGQAWDYYLLDFYPREILPSEVEEFATGRSPAPSGLLSAGIVAEFAGMDMPGSEAGDVVCPIPLSYMAMWFDDRTWTMIRNGREPDWLRFLYHSDIVTITDEYHTFIGRLDMRRYMQSAQSHRSGRGFGWFTNP